MTNSSTESTNAANWIDVGAFDEVPDGAPVCRSAADRTIVLVRRDDELRAFANVCPHAGKPIGDGELRGRTITCPYHGFAYDVGTGRNADFPHDEPPLKMYEVRVADGRVQVRLTA